MPEPNYTPIDDLISQSQQQSTSFPEAGPISTTEQTPAVEYSVPPVNNYVEVKKEVPEIPVEVKKAGVEIHPSAATPPDPLNIPLSDEEIVKGLHKPVSSAWRWLATFALLMLKRSHYTIKVIHGHAKRVLIR
ncbi:hypothetical protein HGA88_04725 [Candidatus Roizmanbacteria bacterium]|nr:hypothetical protein [Candidatus Roizmanbacteria bacterium]